MIVARNTLITLIADMLKDAPAWVESNAGQPRMRHPFTTYLTTDVQLPHPVLTLKTDHNMGRRTPFARLHDNAIEQPRR